MCSVLERVHCYNITKSEEESSFMRSKPTVWSTIYDFTPMRMGDPLANSASITTKRSSFLSLSLSLVTLVALVVLSNINSKPTLMLMLEYYYVIHVTHVSKTRHSIWKRDIRVNLPITRSERHEITGNVAIYLHLYSSPTPSVNPLRKPKTSRFFHGTEHFLSRKKRGEKRITMIKNEFRWSSSASFERRWIFLEAESNLYLGMKIRYNDKRHVGCNNFVSLDMYFRNLANRRVLLKFG